VIDISERNLEATIEDALLAGGPDRRVIRDAAPSAGEFTPGGYHRRTTDDYDRSLCLIPQDVLDFIYATQPREWDAFKKMLGNEAKQRLLKRLAGEIEKRGALDVLRNVREFLSLAADILIRPEVQECALEDAATAFFGVEDEEDTGGEGAASCLRWGCIRAG
jgi:hypothetical protein